MNMLKRILSVILSVAMVFVMLATLVACSDTRDKTASLKVGQYLSELAFKFGMDSYSSDEPHVTGVAKDSEYFDAVQACYEWNVIGSSGVNVDAGLTRKFVTDTLIKAVGSDSIEGKEDKEIATIAKDKGYITFKYKGSGDTDKTVTDEEARNSMDASVTLWAKPVKEKAKSDAQFGEDVVNLTGLSPESIEYGSNGEVMIPKAAINNLNAETVTGDEDNKMTGGTVGTDSIKNGMTYVLPATENKSAMAYKAEDIKENDNYYIIKNDTDAQIADGAIKELHESGTTEVDFNKAVITCGDGTVLSNGVQNVSSYTKPDVAPLGSDVSGASTAATGKLSGSFEIGGVKVSLDIKDGGKSIGFGISAEKLGQSKNLDVSATYTLSDVNVQSDIDVEWFKLKHAKCILDYKLEESKKISVKPLEIKSEYSADFKTAKNASGLNISTFSSALKSASGKTKGHTSIKICSVDLATVGVAAVKFDVRINLTLEGYVELSVVSNDSKGFEYSDNNIRTINDHHDERTLKFGGKAELTLYAGVGAYVVGLEAVGFGVKAGIGFKFDIKATLTDTDHHLYSTANIDNADETNATELAKQTNGISTTLEGIGTVNLKMDICANLKAYWILSLEVSGSSLLGKVTKGKLKWEIWKLGDDAARIWEKHWEDGAGFMDKCSRNYVEVEKTDEEEEKKDVYDVEKSDSIEISDFALDMAPGESKKITIEAVPQGYELSDIKFTSKDGSIATVDANGNVKGVAEGNTTITAATSDGKYHSECSIFIYE